jgi:hypothetical protein
LSKELGCRQPWIHVVCKRLVDWGFIRPAFGLSPTWGRQKPFWLTPDGLVLSLASLLLEREWPHKPSTEGVVRDFLNTPCDGVEGKRLKITHFLDTVLKRHEDLLPTIFQRWKLFTGSGMEEMAKVNLVLSAVSQERLGIWERTLRDARELHARDSRKISFFESDHAEYLMLQDFVTLRIDKYERHKFLLERGWIDPVISMPGQLEDAIHEESMQKSWFETISRELFFRRMLVSTLEEKAKYVENVMRLIGTDESTAVN